MRTPTVAFRPFATILLCACVGCGTGLASSLASVTAAAGANSCSQTNMDLAICNSSTPSGVHGPATAQAIATAGWGSGKLEATSDGFGPATSATASVNYSTMLGVFGASGSGELTIQFTGFEDILAPAGGGSVSPLSVTLGPNSTTVAFPAGGSFSAMLPVTFGTLLPFTLSFSDSASGSMFHDGTFARADADAALTSFPTFLVTDITGAPVPGVTVGIAPEPTTLTLLLCAVPAWWMLRRRAFKA